MELSEQIIYQPAAPQPLILSPDTASAGAKSRRKPAPWPDGPVHRLARQMGCRHPLKLPMDIALRLSDALGCISYGKTMLLWEAENATLSKQDFRLGQPMKIAQLAALRR